MAGVKNILDQTRAGQYEDDAQVLKRQDHSAKTKLYAKHNNFIAPIGRTGYVRAAKTVEILPPDNSGKNSVAKITDMAQIKIKGRR